MGIRLIVGLGNPGREHERTRHNAGFWLVTKLAGIQRVALRHEAKYHGLVAKFSQSDVEYWLVLPQTYMNLSGQAVGSLARFYKISPEEILVVHDDLDLQPGVAKLKFGGGVGGHNGLKDISAALGGPGFWRLRLGIGHPGQRDLVLGYVLSRPSVSDQVAIDEAIDRSLLVFPSITAGQMEAAMHKLHTKVT
ncbi:MAG: aminoacyl-tRNA hydrolase [Burkholderiales bacterium]